MSNIPIYRAKKIDSDEWVEGDLLHNDSIYHIGANCYYSGIKKAVIARYAWEIDPSTLAIHFPNTMIDKNGKKIFASLSHDCVGGDILLINDIKYNLYNFGDTQLEDYNEDEIGNSLDLEYGEYHRDYLSEVREDIEVLGIHKG